MPASTSGGATIGCDRLTLILVMEAEMVEAARGPMGTYRYDAFISYRHLPLDRAAARWLHRAMETYRVPRALVRMGYPARLARVFRDEDELPASADLPQSITEALRDSRFLIVVCTSETPGSRWVNAEIECFRRLGRHDRILGETQLQRQRRPGSWSLANPR